MSQETFKEMLIKLLQEELKFKPSYSYDQTVSSIMIFLGDEYINEVEIFK